MQRNPLLQPESTEATTLDRRWSERVPISGPIVLSLRGGLESTTGQIRDISDEGFRAVHTGLVISSGDYVDFDLGHRRGTARVVWTRATAKERESGFLITEFSGTVS